MQSEKSVGFDSFTAFIQEYKADAKEKGAAEYYHVNVVVDAFNRGKEVGKEEGLDDYLKEVLMRKIELFQSKANQIYILSRKVVGDIKEQNFTACSLHINVNPSRPNVVISVPETALLQDKFIDSIYNNIAIYKKIYFELFEEMLDIGLMPMENIDFESLKEEGYDYHESFS